MKKKMLKSNIIYKLFNEWFLYLNETYFIIIIKLNNKIFVYHIQVQWFVNSCHHDCLLNILIKYYNNITETFV